MSGVYFDREDVIAEAECDPWTAATDFRDEIDVEQMASDSRGFAEAAGKASDAGELASLASEEAADSASTDGLSHHEAEENIAITSRDLQGSGDDIESVADIINSATTLALAASDDVLDLHNDAVSMLLEHQADAEAEYNEKLLQFQQSVDNLAGRITDLTPTPYVTIAGEDYLAGGNVFSGWTFPQDAIDRIREHFLSKAAEDAEVFHGRIEGEIDDYRSAMLTKAGELGDLGYDVGAGPLNLWYNDDMALWAADGLSGELDKANPDPDRLEFYTQGLSGIAEGLYGYPPSAGDPNREMTGEEVAYLSVFFHALEAEDLTTLGAMGNVETGGPDRPTNVQVAQTAVANGINMLMNPDIGGIDPDGEFGAVATPQSIRQFIYDIPESEQAGTRISYHPPSGALSGSYRLNATDIDDFNSLSALMGSASIGSGTAFSLDMVDAALTVGNAEPVRHGALTDADSMRVSSGLLGAASLNPEAAVAVLGDEGETARALDGYWRDTDGLADFIRSGTVPADGVDADPYMAAADNVIRYAAVNHEVLYPGSGGASDGNEEYAPLQRALVETTLNRLPGLLDIANTDTYEQEERYGIFELMAKTDEEASSVFGAGVYAWEANRAYDRIFTVDGGGRHIAAEEIGVLEGLIHHGRLAAIDDIVGGQDAEDAFKEKLVRGTVAAGIGVGGTVASGNPAVGFSLGGTAYGWANGITPNYYQPQAPLDISREQYEYAIYGDLSMRHAMTAAAIQAQDDGELHDDFETGSGALVLPPLDYSAQDDPNTSLYSEEELEAGDDRGVSIDRILSRIEDEAGFDYIDLRGTAFSGRDQAAVYQKDGEMADVDVPNPDGSWSMEN
ncbi:hypothetical protein [Streptomyces mayteni]